VSREVEIDEGRDWDNEDDESIFDEDPDEDE
jgi:hypothetical protein